LTAPKNGGITGLPDDWGLEAMTAEQRNGLLEVMDDRYGKYSTVVVSQLPKADAQRPPAATQGGNRCERGR